MPLEKRIYTPQSEWKELLKEQVTIWVDYVLNIGKSAPRTNVINNRVVHNFRELAEQELIGKNVVKK